MGPVQELIEKKLTVDLKPEFLQVVNESHGHRSTEGAETHFKITAVSREFQGMSAVKRHQLLYKILADELASGVHALALHLYTNDEWDARGMTAPDSTRCAGH